MKKTGLCVFAVTFVLGVYIQVSQADETLPEKVQATSNDIGRGMKKGAHRMEEALCSKGDATCAGKKLKNRVVEAKDATVDGAKKIKNKVD